MPRGRAYSLDFRIAMMKQHAQGRSFATLSREAEVSRDVLRRWWKRDLVRADLSPRMDVFVESLYSTGTKLVCSATWIYNASKYPFGPQFGGGAPRVPRALNGMERC